MSVIAALRARETKSTRWKREPYANSAGWGRCLVINHVTYQLWVEEDKNIVGCYGWGVKVGIEGFWCSILFGGTVSPELGVSEAKKQSVIAARRLASARHLLVNSAHDKGISFTTTPF